MLIPTSNKLNTRRKRRKLARASESARGQLSAREQEATRQRALHLLKEALQVVQEAAQVVKECSRPKTKKRQFLRDL